MNQGRLKEREGDGTLGTVLLIIVSALLCFGALMVFSAGASVDQDLDLKQFWKFSTLRRVAFVPLAWIVLLTVSKFDYRRWLVWENHFWWSPVVWLTGLSVVLLVLVLIPGIGTPINNSFRWFKFQVGPIEITFQPSELAKWFVVMFLAVYASRQGDKMRQFVRGFLPGIAVLLVITGLIGKEDFGTAALVVAVGVVVLLLGGVKFRHMLILIPLAAIAFYFMVYKVDYRWDRVVAWWQQSQSSTAVESPSAYQARQSITAIGAGGMWGKGLGNGTMKFGWVPEDTTDFVFAVIGEELGFVGCTLVVGLFISILFCGMLVIRRAPTRQAELLSVASAGTIGAQAAMNLAVVVGLAPTKGIALPFISAGGSGLVLTALAAGVMVNIARQEKSAMN
jgi:cell division protein FtsW